MKKKDLIKLSGLSTASMAKESGEDDGKQETSNQE